MTVVTQNKQETNTGLHFSFQSINVISNKNQEYNSWRYKH